MVNHLVVFVTASSEAEANHIGSTLVEQKLAACASLTPVRSVFSWRGKIENQNEVLLIIKTKAACFNQLAAVVKELHSYEVPEIIALPIVDGSAEYLTWIDEETQ